MNKTKSLCEGCRNDYYNTERSGCWSYEGAVVEQKKFVGLSDVPPWTSQPVVTTLSCYRKPGYVAVKPEQVR